MTDICDVLRGEIDFWCGIDPNSRECDDAVDMCVDEGCPNCHTPGAAPNTAKRNSAVPEPDLSVQQQLPALQRRAMSLMRANLDHLSQAAASDDLPSEQALAIWREQFAVILEALAALRATKVTPDPAQTYESTEE